LKALSYTAVEVFGLIVVMSYPNLCLMKWCDFQHYTMLLEMCVLLVQQAMFVFARKTINVFVHSGAF
jgi:hypothetical protein